MDRKQTIWVVEDDSGCQFVYEEILSPRFQTKIFSNLEDFLAARNSVIEEERPHLVTMDLNLPGRSFLSLLSSKEHNIFEDLPFLVVSSIDDLDALRLCYERGALDYITKPFSKNELLVKVERCLIGLRGELGKGEYDDLVLDPTFLSATRRGITISNLTMKEMQILSLLRHARHNTILRQDIMSKVWGKISVSAKTLDVHMFNLRRKIVVLGLEIKHIPPCSYTLIPQRNVGNNEVMYPVANG